MDKFTAYKIGIEQALRRRFSGITAQQIFTILTVRDADGSVLRQAFDMGAFTAAEATDLLVDVAIEQNLCVIK